VSFPKREKRFTSKFYLSAITVIRPGIWKMPDWTLYVIGAVSLALTASSIIMMWWL
jgi:hypothetical protein